MKRMIAVLRQSVQAKLQNEAAHKTGMPSAVKTPGCLLRSQGRWAISNPHTRAKH